MAMLVLGLLLFIGSHSLRMLAPAWRERVRARHGDNAWKGVYSLLALAGFLLMLLGYGRAASVAVPLRAPSPTLRGLNSLFTLVAFVLVFAANVPRNHFKAALGHPMVAGVAVWSFGHLLATTSSRAVLLFGALLAWSAVNFILSRRRDAREGVRYGRGSLAGTAGTLLVGAVAWAVFALFAHARWIGASPFG